MKSKITFLSLLLAAGLSFSCEEDDKGFCSNTLEFDIDLFVEGVQEDLNDPENPISGYQFVVNREGNRYHSEAEGFARYDTDDNGRIDMTENTKVNVASVSKFIGAIALMKAMEDHNISQEFNVVNYLPQPWQGLVHPDFSNVDSPAYLTFLKLMRMETAISFIGNPPPASGDMLSEPDMLLSLAAPPDLTRIGEYQNSNFTLIRVLIGEIVYNLDVTSGDYSTKCTEKYFDYLQDNIFNPLSINTFTTPQQVEDYYDISTTYPYAYQYPFNEDFIDPTGNGNLGWAHTAGAFLNGGSSGLVLSALDLAKILAFFRFDDTETLMSAAQRDRIIDGHHGLYETRTNGTHGTYLIKGGTRGPDGRTSRGQCCDRAIRSTIIMFPNGIDAVIVTNSWHTTLSSMLRSNFDDAWVNSCQ